MSPALALAVLVAGTDPASLSAAARSTCAAFPLRTTGAVVHYFCDCQPGAQAGCVAGSDTNAATGCASPAAACRSWTEAVRAFDAMAGGDTIALCKGGAWTTATAAQLANPRCAPPADLRTAANGTTCDLRDYAAPWGGTARPIVRQTGAANLLEFWNGGTKGVRILNLDLEGGGGGPGGTDVGQRAIALDDGNTHFLVCNDTINGWYHAIHINNRSAASHIDVWGNRITRNSTEGILGAASHSTLDANFFDDNGGAHTIYAAGEGIVDFSIVHNELRRSGDVPCTGAILVVHDSFDGLNIEGNVVDGGRDPVGGCYAIQIDAGGYPRACSYRHLTIRRNSLTGFGTSGIGIAEAPGAVIENNVVVAVLPGTWGIEAASGVHRTDPADDATTDVTIRNNTVSLISGYGITTSREGAGYVVANNAVSFTGAGTRICFDDQLGPSAYAFVGNNACHQGTWGTTYGATPHLTADPLFVDPPDDFSLQPGSPLLGAADPGHAPAVDLLGNPRPGAPAIGAFDAGAGGGGGDGGGGSTGGGSTGGGSTGGGSNGAAGTGGGAHAGGCRTSGGLPGAPGALVLLVVLALSRRRVKP